MGAFYESNHWMLIVTCLGLNTIYILDSNQINKKTLEIKARLRGAWILHCVQSGRRNFAYSNKLFIKVIKCPQQSMGYECGYYCMKWKKILKSLLQIQPCHLTI